MGTFVVVVFDDFFYLSVEFCGYPRLVDTRLVRILCP